MSPYILLLLSCTLLIFGDEATARWFFRGRYFSHQRRKAENVHTYWFSQKLDHFEPTDNRTWNQRYFITEKYFKPGGPIFLMIGGEGEVNTKWMDEGAWIEYAKKLNAYCFQIEHRFYGKSHPTKDLSLENLKYLSSEQALADLAYFTQEMKEKHNFTENKWVAFGGSYPGNLAAWYRMKYPHLVDIAVSSSAPVFAKLDFKEYLEVVERSISLRNPICSKKILRATKELEMLLLKRTGWKIIERDFNLCEKLDGSNRKDVAQLFEILAGNFEGIVQYNEDNRSFEGSSTANITIDTLCDIMTSNDVKYGSDVQRYAAVNQLLLQTTKQNCTDFKYKNVIDEMRHTNWNSSAGSGERQWTYQTCTEFGFFQTADSKNQPFGNRFTLVDSLRICRDVFNPNFDQSFVSNRIKWTNTNYGGRHIKVSKVIFVNGSIDPWHALSITSGNQTSNSNEVVYIKGTAHCANMYPDAKSDIPELRKARKEIFIYLQKWLSE